MWNVNEILWCHDQNRFVIIILYVWYLGYFFKIFREVGEHDYARHGIFRILDFTVLNRLLWITSYFRLLPSFVAACDIFSIMKEENNTWTTYLARCQKFIKNLDQFLVFSSGDGVVTQCMLGTSLHLEL